MLPVYREKLCVGIGTLVRRCLAFLPVLVPPFVLVFTCVPLRLTYNANDGVAVPAEAHSADPCAEVAATGVKSSKDTLDNIAPPTTA